MEPRDSPDWAAGDWFVDAFRAELGKLTPLVSGDAYQAALEAQVLEPLISRDPETLDWRPWIAHSWSVSDDGLIYTYDLRNDVRFSDGKPLTSDDVVFTYEWIMNPEVDAPRARSYYERIESVEADGPHRVIFKLSEPYFEALSITGGLSVMARHYYEPFGPEEFNTSAGLLFGSGPYKLPMDPEDWQPGRGQVELIRNERYWGPRPVFDRLVWRIISDETATLTSFRNGEVDRYAIPPEKYPILHDDAGLLDQGELYTYRSAAAGYRYLGWNQERNGEPTPFADKRVRQAMTLLTNREEMKDQLMQGQATVATGPFSPETDQPDPDLEPWPYDPNQAKALLKEAGYEDRDGNGVLESPQGKELRFQLIHPSGNDNYQQMAFYLKDNYARAGVVLEPDPTEWNTMIQKMDSRDFDAITLGWGGSIESDPYQIFHSAQIEGGDNYISYRNEQLDELIEAARVTVDDAARTELWHEVHRVLHEDQPYTFLFNGIANVFVDKRFRNVEVTKVGLNDVLELYVPRELQRYTQ